MVRKGPGRSIPKSESDLISKFQVLQRASYEIITNTPSNTLTTKQPSIDEVYTVFKFVQIYNYLAEKLIFEHDNFKIDNACNWLLAVKTNNYNIFYKALKSGMGADRLLEQLIHIKNSSKSILTQQIDKTLKAVGIKEKIYFLKNYYTFMKANITNEEYLALNYEDSYGKATSKAPISGFRWNTILADYSYSLQKLIRNKCDHISSNGYRYDIQTPYLFESVKWILGEINRNIFYDKEVGAESLNRHTDWFLNNTNYEDLNKSEQ